MTKEEREKLRKIDETSDCRIFLHKALDALDEAEEVIRFYADRHNYDDSFYDEAKEIFSSIGRDDGTKAREYLEKYK